MFNKIKKFVVDYLAWLIVAGVGILCAIFIISGTPSENGSITLDGKDAQIEEYTEKFIENANDTLYRIMNEDAPTDDATIKEFEDAEGLGAATTIDQVYNRRLPDGDMDGGKGWQCSKYTAYLATGKRQYSTAHENKKSAFMVYVPSPFETQELTTHVIVPGYGLAIVLTSFLLFVIQLRKSYPNYSILIVVCLIMANPP